MASSSQYLRDLAEYRPPPLPSTTRQSCLLLPGHAFHLGRVRAVGVFFCCLRLLPWPQCIFLPEKQNPNSP